MSKKVQESEACLRSFLSILIKSDLGTIKHYFLN